MSKGYEIIHVTTVHPRNDTRIFRKMCTDLAAAGFEVSLFTTDGLPSEEKNNVKIVNLDKRRTMIARIMISHVFVLLKILKNRNAIYHFHDPELLVIGAILSILKFNSLQILVLVVAVVTHIIPWARCNSTTNLTRSDFHQGSR